MDEEDRLEAARLEEARLRQLNRAWMRDAPPDQKRVIMRTEIVRHISLLVGYATLIQQWATEDPGSDIPEKLGTWLDQIGQAVRELKDTYALLTGPGEGT